MNYVEKPAKWKQQWIQMNQQPRVPVYINPQVLARAAASQQPSTGTPPAPVMSHYISLYISHCILYTLSHMM